MINEPCYPTLAERAFNDNGARDPSMVPVGNSGTCPGYEVCFDLASQRARIKTAPTNSRNARFWFFFNGDWTKLTLKPGQEIVWTHGGQTDEGWFAEAEHLVYDAKKAVVIRRWKTDGRDCDGRLAQGGEQECSITRLAAREIDGLRVLRRRTPA